MLTEPQTEYYKAYEALFDSLGWKLLVEEFIEPALENIPEQAFEYAKNFPELVQARGQLAAYREFAAIPAQIALQKESHIQENLALEEEKREASRPDV